jgi:hypothetical protein
MNNMGKIVIKAFVLLFVLSLGLFSSCSKESYSGNEDEASSNTALWDNEVCKVSYAKVPSVLSVTGPHYNTSFDLKISLDDSEEPSKYIDVSLMNYNYGEKVDLTTNKYDTKFTIVDETQKPKLDFDVNGGFYNMNQGSYFLLSRSGDDFTIDMQLNYTNYNGFSHSIKVKYKGAIIGSASLPSVDWKEQLEENYTYKFNFNGKSCRYSSFPQFQVDKDEAYFCVDLIGGMSSFSVWTANFEYGKQIPIVAAQVQEEGQGASELLWKDAILDGSYILVNKNANKLEYNDIIIKLNCKKGEKLYKFDIEYKGEVRNG